MAINNCQVKKSKFGFMCISAGLLQESIKAFFRNIIPHFQSTCLPQVLSVNRQFHPLSVCNISQSLSAWWWVYCVCVTQMSLSLRLPGYLSSKHNNRYLLLSFSLPPTTHQAPALCLLWQQCEVNRMNKTYLNQSPLPWEMSSCQYSLMGKHRADPKGQTVYCAAPKNETLPAGFFVYHKHTNPCLLSRISP